MGRDRKQWVLIDDILPSIAAGTSLQLTVGGQVIFEHARVWNELDDKYSLFSYLCDKRSTPYALFLSHYTFYCANMGEQYARMLDAITRKYNPINNYEMIESGADGRKQSKKTDTDNLDSLSGTKTADHDTKRTGAETHTRTGTETHTRTGTETHTRTGTETHSRTSAGTQTTDHYENAFDSGISANGTHTGRDVTQLPTYTDTIGYGAGIEDTIGYGAGIEDSISYGDGIQDTISYGTGITDKTSYDNDQSQSMTVGNESLSVTGQNATAGHSRNTKTEDYENDVSVSAKKQNPDGTESSLALGTDFTDGTMHVFTRSGNIGVTTSMQMVSGEMEREKLNLLKMWVKGFISEYCSYIGSDD